MADEEKRSEEEAAQEEAETPQAGEGQAEQGAETQSEDGMSSEQDPSTEESAEQEETSDSKGESIPPSEEDTLEASVADAVAAAQAGAAAEPDATASAEVPESSDGHGAHDDEHFAHTAPKSLLFGVFAALIMLTILTVGVTAIDLGSQGNFIVAMVIATVKAALVMAYFMHMLWDNRFNVVAFTSSFLFVLLFLAMSLTDRGEYQEHIDSFENDVRTQELAE